MGYIAKTGEFVEEFVGESKRFLNKCDRPSTLEVKRIAMATAVGFVVMGFVGMSSCHGQSVWAFLAWCISPGDEMQSLSNCAVYGLCFVLRLSSFCLHNRLCGQTRPHPN